MNYTELVDAIQDFTANTDSTFVANIPLFVKAAEKRIYSAAELPVKGVEATGFMTANNKYLTLPTDFLFAQEVARINSDGTQDFLLQKDTSFIREVYPDPTVTGPPKFYALFDVDTFLLAPTPDVAYGVELHYSAFPTSIVTAGSTWLGDNYEHVLLYGSLVEAYTFMKGDEDMLKQYASLLADGVQALKQYADVNTQTDFYRQGA